MKCGLLGRTLGHSYSPQIHNLLAAYEYTLIEKEPEQLDAFFTESDFQGLNVTMPYKKDVIPYCDQLTPIAQELGSVNTIVRMPDGTLLGHNTDYYGFQSMVKQSRLSLAAKKVLVLGSGGASSTVVAVLQKLNAQPVVISRTGENNYHNLHLHTDASVIVNTTPVGMYPNNYASPIDLNLFPCLEGVLDIVYNPARTALLQQAQQKNLITQNGLWMLVAQAKQSCEYFLGRAVPDERIAQIHNILANQMKNIILIGMPGCGKSTLGQALAQQLNRKFVDCDVCVTELAGIPIRQIFATKGNDGFRALETQCLKDLGKESGLVIATGGGCVTREENYNLLHQNGNIFWIHREISQLPTDGRPLSQQTDLSQMYQQRQPLYRAFCDYEISNNSTLDAALEQILAVCKEDL